MGAKHKTAVSRLPILLLWCVGIVLALISFHSARCSVQQPSANVTKPGAKLLVMSYAWGEFGKSQVALELFVKSLRATKSNADIVILTHELSVRDATSSFLHTHNVTIEMVPEELRRSSAAFVDPVLFRFVAWSYYLERHKYEYSFVMTTDLDIFIQEDPLACFPQLPMLQVFEENQAIDIGKCPFNSKWVRECRDVQGRRGADIFQRIQHKGRLCDAVIYGDVGSMSHYLAIHAAEENAAQCNDQGLLNMLVWDEILPVKAHPVVVFNNFYGPVKTTDVGGYRDEQGYVLNNNGRRYCLLHQFKSSRAPRFVAQLQKQLHGRQEGQDRLYPSVEFFHVDDNMFPEGVHPSANLTSWPELPADRKTWQSSPWGYTAVFASTMADSRTVQLHID